MTTNVSVVSKSTEASLPFDLAVPMGVIPGYSSVNKFGANASSAAGVVEEVWDGSAAYVYPATALMVKMSQTADQELMRGANIEIQGLDANWEAVTQIKALDGTLTTTPVVLDTPLIRCFRMKVLANVVSDSPIRIHNTGESQDYAIIGVGNNQTLMALYTIPAGKTAYMTCYYGDVVEDVNAAQDPDSTDFELWAADRHNGYEFQLKHSRAIPKGNSGFRHCFKPYYKFTQKTDLKITSLCIARAGALHAGFDLILVNN